MDRKITSDEGIMGNPRIRKTGIVRRAPSARTVRAAARNKKKLTNKNGKKLDGRVVRVSKPAMDVVLKSFQQKVDMPEFKEALKLSKDPKFEMLLAALSNPRLQKCSFAELCRRCDLTFNDVITLWKNHQIDNGFMLWMNDTPGLMKDVMVDSRSKVTVCPRCAGVGILEDEKINNQERPICPICNGDGSVRTVGDKDSRAHIFEGIGLKKSGMGHQFNVVNLGQGVPSLEEDLADMEKVFDADFEEVTDVVPEKGPEAAAADRKRLESGQDPGAGDDPGQGEAAEAVRQG